jgi:hypothetical protein
MKTHVKLNAGIRIWLIGYAAFCLLLPAVFIRLHLAIPSDGARLSRQETIFSADGAVVSPYRQGSSLLKEGDVVMAVNGVNLLTWSQGLIHFGKDRQTWQERTSAQYTVQRNGQITRLDIPLARLPLGAILSEHWSLFAFFLAAQVLAAFVYWNKPNDPAARVFFIWAFSGSHTYTWAFFLQVSDILNPAGFWLFHFAATGLWLVFWAALAHMVMVFPKPLFRFSLSPRWIFLLYLSPFVIFATYLAWTWQVSANLLEWLNSWGTGQTLIAVVYILPSLVFTRLQYATAHIESERIKHRWVAFGTLISLGLGMSLYFVPSLLGKSFLSPNALGLINFPFIITLSIAIWRYRLFDIDIIIRKTLVYALLSGLLSLLYFSGVALFQAILTADRGLLTAGEAVSGQLSAVVIVITTLAIAALFNPLRRRIQDFIDRRFYRRKYDAEKALAEFAAAARSETELKALTNSLLQLVQETLQPSGLSLWSLPVKRTKGTSQEEGL